MEYASLPIYFTLWVEMDPYRKNFLLEFVRYLREDELRRPRLWRVGVPLPRHRTVWNE
jgi:hypothetical protein